MAKYQTPSQRLESDLRAQSNAYQLHRAINRWPTAEELDELGISTKGKSTIEIFREIKQKGFYNKTGDL